MEEGEPGGARAADVLACQYGAWHPRFRAGGHALPARVLPVPPGFPAFLAADGVHLPAGSQALYTRAAPDPLGDYRQEFSSSDEEGDADAEAKAAAAAAEGEVPFREFLAEVDEAIRALGGAVTPKLNWSSPKDAAWINPTQSLRCENADTVVLMLKASDRVAHDLGDAFAGCADVDDPARYAAEHVQFTLVLREWFDLRPGREFRCFVAGRELRGVSQRDPTRFFPDVLAEEGDLARRLAAFHAGVVRDAFPSRDYAYDVYVPAQAGAAPKLIDFNPAGGTTNPLLFGSWDAVRAAGGGEGATPEVRLVRTAVGVQPAERALAGVPFDLVDASEGSALQEFLAKMEEEEHAEGEEGEAREGGGGGRRAAENAA